MKSFDVEHVFLNVGIIKALEIFYSLTFIDTFDTDNIQISLWAYID